VWIPRRVWSFVGALLRVQKKKLKFRNYQERKKGKKKHPSLANQVIERRVVFIFFCAGFLNF
jgi:hypothetical protein